LKFSGYLHGTRGYINQINESITLEITVKNEFNALTDKMIDYRMKAFLSNNMNKTKANFIEGSSKTNCENLLPEYQVLIKSKILEINQLETFKKAKIDNKGI
jgi:hypothetical protein